MRLIKFRVWKDGKKYRVKTLVWRDGEIFMIQIDDGNCDWLYTWDALEQFTGLTDKNGVEIYEGDKVRGKSELPQVVKWNTLTDEKSTLMEGFLFPYKKYSIFEVVGNIHEAPELMNDEC
jgi:uncharacterized phage protein (TIGR01671 family)